MWPRSSPRPRALLTCLLAAAAVLRASATPSVTISPSTLTQNGENITVTWSGITGVQESDVVALIHNDPDVNYGLKYPIKFIWLYQSANDTFRTGAGTAT